MKMLVVGDFQGDYPEKLKKKLAKEEFDFVIGVGDYGGLSDWRPYFKKMFKLSKAREGYLSAEEYFGKKKLMQLEKKDKQAAKNVLSELNKIGKKVIYIFGNTDDGWYNYPFDDKVLNAEKSKRRFVKRLKNMNLLNYQTTNYAGFSILGFGGYMDVAINSNKPQDDEELERYERRMERIKRTRKKLYSLIKKMGKEKIFIMHYPPKGVFDIIRDKSNPYNGGSAGTGMFREAILKYKPKLVLCGHMHEYQGAKRLGKSIVINPGDAQKGKYAVVEILDDGKIKTKFVK